MRTVFKCLRKLYANSLVKRTRSSGRRLFQAIGPTIEKSQQGIFKTEQQAHIKTQNNDCHDQSNLKWSIKAPVSTHSIPHLVTPDPDQKLKFNILGNRHATENIKHIVQDMTKFWSATNKPKSCMQHTFKLPNVSKGGHINGTAVVNLSTHKYKSKWEIICISCNWQSKHDIRDFGLNLVPTSAL